MRNIVCRDHSRAAFFIFLVDLYTEIILYCIPKFFIPFVPKFSNPQSLKGKFISLEIRMDAKFFLCICFFLSTWCSRLSNAVLFLFLG